MIKNLLDPPCLHEKAAFNNDICFYIQVLLESEDVKIMNTLIIFPIGKLIILLPKKIHEKQSLICNLSNIITIIFSM